MVQASFLNKDYLTMSVEELQAAHQYWCVQVEEAAGWSSAYYAARQLQHVCYFGNRKGLKMVNPHPIKVG